ncbi:BREX-6 system adenine-specific DNA-methyltransferase PglX, partial [Actinoplanes sp. ATCC 53533]|uniref:BREX-6 system adenine-specific DNA-methyltransferase PglX n=1 Tax=Actinoplanes sp. ATCC 53533 TaxID=1288362 RepID=UPI000F768EC6
MPMTSHAKRTLSATIRSLRLRLLADLHDATETAYRLLVRAQDAGLDAAGRTRRARLEAWVAEQLRAQQAAKIAHESERSAEDFRREAEKQAAYTLLNRLVLLRLMEAPRPLGDPLRTPAVVTGGWESRAYKDFRQLAPGLVRADETEGYAFLLRLTFEDLATELPGLYGPAGVADLVPVPASTLRHVVDTLDAEVLESCWTDDMTLGWVYQYWNDPEREALDDKLNGGGKVEPHEIASKTQMFTERYMVDWLLQNSLGPMWLAMCQRHGWTPEVQADGTLDRLEEQRAEWRAKRASGAVALTELMPLHTEAERRWAYYLSQPIPENAVEQVPNTVRDLKLIDPAVGSGHFLVVALDLLMALYREEARHRGEAGTEHWSDRSIVERILSHNLHGIDLDPRAVQIAAAALWLKARQIAPDARPERLNLVASNLRLASLADDDPALVELRREVERETGIPGALTDTLIHALRGADHLGSLLKVDTAVDDALNQHEATLGRVKPEQGDLFAGFKPEPERIPIGKVEAKATLLELIEGFLTKHTSGDDLGLRLRGEQLAAGVRF